MQRSQPIPNWVTYTPRPDTYSLNVSFYDGDPIRQLSITREEFMEAKAAAAANMSDDYALVKPTVGKLWFELIMSSGEGESVQEVGLPYLGVKAVLQAFYEARGVTGYRELFGRQRRLSNSFEHLFDSPAEEGRNDGSTCSCTH